ncbi:MAG: hypothetical protein HUK17_00020 [Bacteroidales bacterium]|nr:hypothetical protein [Bacteroidales bacterium]
MKKIAKVLLSLLIIVGLTVVCGTTTSCKSSDTMYRAKAKKGKVINRNYKVRGDNTHNGSTYRTY